MEQLSIEESIKDILSTRLGSRVMLPDYGSRLFELIDKRVDDVFKANLAWYVIEAVEKWESRVKIDEVKLISNENHKLKFRITFSNYQDMEYSI